jgi:carboxyl-terminal processing protease
MAQRDDDYAWVRTLVEVHRQVVNNYVEPVDDTQLKEKAIEGMLSDLDPFTDYFPPEKQEEFDRMLDGNFKGVGIILDKLDDKQVTVVSPIEGSPAARAGVEAGDVIVAVDGQSVAGLSLDEVIKKVAGPIHSQVRLTVRRDGGQKVDLTMTREEIILPTVKGYDHNKDDSWNYWVCQNPKICYVRITQFDSNTFADLQKVMVGTPASAGNPARPGLIDSGMKGMILDLRFNPGGLLDQAVKVVNLFVKEGVIVTTRGRARPEQVERANGEGTLPNFPMVVLVNDLSASAAEIVSGSLKDNRRALIIGQRTYGKGSVQERIPLDNDGGELKLTVAYYYLPSGRLVHRKKGATDWGVEPQIIVPMDENGEHAIQELFVRQETIHRPAGYKAATQSSTQPSTQPTDPQLAQALNTLVGKIVLDNTSIPAANVPTTMPSTPK